MEKLKLNVYSHSGISTTKWTRVSLNDLPTSLNCLRECFTAAGLKTHYTDVKLQADPAGDNTYTGTVLNASPSPYADVGPYIKKAISVTRTYEAGTENEWSETEDFAAGQHRDRA